MEEVFVRVCAGELPGVWLSRGQFENTVLRVCRLARERRRRTSACELRLRFVEREVISRGLAAGESFRSIARSLGRAPSTVSREVASCGGRARYRAQRAHAWPSPPGAAQADEAVVLVQAPGGGPKTPDRAPLPRADLGQLKVDFPDDEEMRISHETIYQSLYIQSRGELRRQLTANLRTKRTRRKVGGTGLGARGKIKGMVPISQRPPEVADRAVPGHWEGDLLVGAYGRSFIATLVERQTRYVMLGRLGGDGTPARDRCAQAAVRELPAPSRSR